MASFINARDAIAAAVEIESRGLVFYRNAAAQAASESDREFFTFMADEEKHHEEIFAAMLKRLGGLEPPAGSSGEEYLAYVKSLLDSHTLFTPGLEERILKDPLLEAVTFEKDTLLFFTELENMVPDAERKHVRACANEERRHIHMLLKRKD